MDTDIQGGRKISLPHGARATLRAESRRARVRYEQSLTAGERLWWGEGKWVRIAKPLPWLCRPVPGRAGRTKAGRRAGPAAQAGLGRLDNACIAASKAINLHTDNGKCEMRPSA